jgi:phage gp36-like protein
MSYTTSEHLRSALPPQHLADALDDDRDGQPDEGLLEQVLSEASNAVDAYLAGRYTVPFAAPPAAVEEAALVFACELLYDRRQLFAENPWRGRAEFWRERLQQVGQGRLPLDMRTDEATGKATWGSRDQAESGTEA